jgi:hypothetical protein
MFRSLRARFQKKDIDIGEYRDNPLELYYKSTGPWVTDIPVSHYRSNFLGFRADTNPLVKMLLSEDKTYDSSAVHRFYDQFQPTTVGDVLNIETSKVASFPAMSAVMPWWTKTPEARLAQVCIDTDQKPYLGKEAHRLGAEEGRDYGWHYFGPVSKAVGITEFERQRSVFDSIRTRGYKPTSLLHIHGEFLIHGKNWVWVNLGGKHRFNALAALGYTSMTVSVKNKYGPAFVRREDVDSWPNVVNGLFDREEALKIFDRLLLGRDVA